MFLFLAMSDVFKILLMYHKVEESYTILLFLVYSLQQLTHLEVLQGLFQVFLNLFLIYLLRLHSLDDI